VASDRQTSGYSDERVYSRTYCLTLFELPTTGATVTYHTGFEVFDAHTGNFLMAGGLN